MLGVPCVDQRPTFQGAPIKNGTTLRDNNIRHGDVINLEPMQIKVKAPDGSVAKLFVKPNFTISDIKNRVEEELGIPIEDQRPTFRDVPLENDRNTLRENDIRNGDVINLEPMEIGVKAPDGSTAKFIVTPEDTIQNIKKKVKKALRIPVEDQRPTFEAEPLENDSTLRDNNIRHGDVINLEPMEIRVKTPDGRTVNLAVTPDDTIQISRSK